jgi:excinuclease ABC subunit A
MQNPPIVLKKVRVHNLKGVDLTLEPGKLIVFTGVSGSGKSSLAFDTIYVEGQRRYIESLSHQARRNMGDLPKPEAESIEGVAPTIAIEQKQGGNNPRSTVGTMTGIYDFLRVLYARIAVPYCPVSKEPVAAQSREKIVATLHQTPKGTKIALLAPYARGKKGEFKEDFAELLAKGFIRLRIDGEWVELGEIERLDPSSAHDVDIVVDRLVIQPENLSRLTEAAHLALELGKGIFSLYHIDSEEETIYSQFAYSQASKLSYGPLEPHDFSFNHPSGMCPACHGLGISRTFNLDTIINPNLSIAEDCCTVASSYQTVRYGNIYDNLAKLYGFKVNTPWKKLPEKAKEVFLYGNDKKWTRIDFVHPEKKSRWHEYIRWQGVLHEANERFTAAKSEAYRKKMGEWMTEGTCPSCQGARIKPYPAAARLGGKTIQQLTALTLQELHDFLQNMPLSDLDRRVGEELLKEALERLQFLSQVGVHYLSLERSAPTLSGGESQRVRLAAQIGAGLVGAIYVLDEPSIGLHPADHHKLIGTLLALRDQGNTVLVVEHDIDTMLAADSIVDVGPGAGAHGGRLIAQGDVHTLSQAKESITGGYLSGRLSIEVPKKRRPLKQGALLIRGATHHNLKNIDVKLPLGGLLCVTGVSGSGKSSLIRDILYPALSNHFHLSQLKIGAHKKIEGIEALDKVIAVDQTPIGRTPRSNAATYIKLFDEIRDLFTELPESKLRGFTAGHFSFNVKEGSCPYCGGLGQVKIDMDFMEDAWVQCPQCRGKRFEPDILSVQFKGKSIHDILETDVEHALELFQDLPLLRKKLEVLSRVGLDYLKLGQPSTTLSGGEAQRIKLAKELVRPATGKTLYILDEPTTGLHFEDVKRLIHVLQELVGKGNTVLVIEHNMDLVKTADWVIELGPEAGIHGGELIGCGTPETLAKQKTATGLALLQAMKPPKIERPKKERLPLAAAPPFIEIEGASQNNLKNVSVSIPRGKITVFTGPSGSGKSSLAFDTLYAEGQRRYTETLPAYSRQFVKQLPKPKVERIEGLSPSIALEQKTGGLNPRSTIGTLTEIYDLLRVLYAHLGTAYCPESGEAIRHISKESVVRKILSLPEGEKIHLLSPVSPPKKETFEEWKESWARRGFLRIRLNGSYYELDQPIPFEKHRMNELYLVIDRMTVQTSNDKRLFEAVEKATSLSNGIVIVHTEKQDLFFNLSFAVEKTGKSYPPITPQTFSFNAESGMCPECQGLGLTYGAHLEDSAPLLKRSILEVCDRLFKEHGNHGAYLWVERYFKKEKVDVDVPLKELPAQALDLFLNGGKEVALTKGLSLRWMGLHTFLAHAARMSQGEIREAILPLLSTHVCPACQGARLNPLARHVKVNDLSIADVCNLPLEEASLFLSKLDLSKHPFLQETHLQIGKYFSFLLSIGLGYLSLHRSAPTLSGGELQRIRLARQLGLGLTSCLYILDEPTIGLHPHNNALLNQALQTLCKQGNTLVLVEHDPLTVQAADYLVDFGPKAGKEGGMITAVGTLEEIKANPHSLTGAYLRGEKSIPIPAKRRPFSPDIRIEKASLHNLKNISVAFPKSAITCITGVSGSGKSSLIRHLLKPAAEKIAYSRKKPAEPFLYKEALFYGLSSFEKVVAIDQSPIGQTARADVSTYTEIQPLLRSHYAQMTLAEVKGLQPRHFSPNHKSGMCRTCWGLGYKNVDLQFLPTVRVPCESCKGYRLGPLSLEVQYRGKHLGQVLEMSVEEALRFFHAIPRVVRKLETLVSVGLGYLQLGQEIASLSGGEAQRLRLSRELAKREAGKTLYLIDEPTVGLHSDDIAKLIPIFHRLAEKKNTLILIEHNLDLIANADYVIDLGPDAGAKGGHVMAQGTPEQVGRSKKSKTAPFLREYLEMALGAVK